MAGNAPPTSTFNCPACDMSITVRSLGKASVVACHACGTIIDTADSRMRVIQRFQKEMSKPLVPIGSKGKFQGTDYMVIGYMVRRTGSGEFFWEEYLLMNPYKGFAWLSHFDGHWSFLLPIKDAPLIEDEVAWYQKRKYKLFAKDRAVVSTVLGEFYWIVSTGDTSKTEDYINPPYILSKERSEGEEVWSTGEYYTASKIEKVFQIKSSLPPKSGIGMIQPNPWKQRAVFSGFLAVATIIVMFVAHSILDRRNPKLLFERDFIFDPAAPTSAKITTGEFEITGRTTNLEVEARASVDNSWIYADLTLLDITRDEEDDGGVEVSYYHGVDSDGTWREGGQVGKTYFTDLEPGRYNIVAEVSSGEAKAPVSYVIRAYQDIATTENLVALVILIGIVPIICVLGVGFFEDARWKNSDA
jgi:hypothetical protein